MKTAIKIDSDNWAAWLEALATLRSEDQELYQYLHGVDCDASLFDLPDFQAKIKDTGLRCLHERNLVPEDVPAALEMAIHQRCLPQLYTRIYNTMATAGAAADCQSFSMPFRLDRLSDNPPEASGAADSITIPRLAIFLARLLFAPINPTFTVLIPVRLPRPFPKSQEIARALELCRSAQETTADSSVEGDWVPSDKRSATRGGQVGICLHLYPDEGIMPDCQDPALIDLAPFLKNLCFHYNVTAGETLFDDEQANWASRLADNGYQGNVIFCPDECPPADLPEILRNAALWAKLYQQ